MIEMVSKGCVRFDAIIEDDEHCSSECVNYNICTDNTVECGIRRERILESFLDKGKAVRTEICKELFVEENEFGM